MLARPATTCLHSLFWISMQFVKTAARMVVTLWMIAPRFLLAAAKTTGRASSVTRGSFALKTAPMAFASTVNAFAN